MVREDPGHGHLDGELDPAAHGQLQEELPEPQLRQVTAVLQGLWGESSGSVVNTCSVDVRHRTRSQNRFNVQNDALMCSESEGD